MPFLSGKTIPVNLRKVLTWITSPIKRQYIEKSGPEEETVKVHNFQLFLTICTQFNISTLQVRKESLPKYLFKIRKNKLNSDLV
jgi:hypothetical protein